MAHKVFDLVKQHSDTTGPAKTVLLLIADHAGAEDGSGARLGEERLAVEAGLSVRTVQRAIAEAENLDELEVERGRRSRGRQAVNRYRVRVEVLQAKPGLDVRLERLQAERAAIIEASRSRADTGEFSATDWAEILLDHGFRCAYCGAVQVPLEQEHRIPLSRGGGHTRANVAPACGPCNRQKGKKTEDEFRRWLIRQGGA
jgi:5-methylcytosine-specific restriction endonuclease McrA